MKESQFKVGDKVVIIRNHHSGVDNEIGVIVSINNRNHLFVDSPSIRKTYNTTTTGAGFLPESIRELTPLEELL